MKLSIRAQSLIAAGIIALIPALFWYGILSIIQYVIIKSGGHGEWLADYKFYVALSFYALAFVVIRFHICIALHTKSAARNHWRK